MMPFASVCEFPERVDDDGFGLLYSFSKRSHLRGRSISNRVAGEIEAVRAGVCLCR